MADLEFPASACPLPLNEYPRVLLAHGGGGRLMHRLIDTVFAPAFANSILARQHDAAELPFPAGRIVVTTDSFTVRPLFFPGGDIGSLAVNGTVNDLAMVGARPRYLTAAFILEEGLETAVLVRIVQSMAAAARSAGVLLVAGDTKVVERGKADGMYIAAAGIGVIEHDLLIGPESVRPGDAVLVNGDLGRHGIAVLAAREELAFETGIFSDCAPLHEPVLALLDAGVTVHCLRDLTRGGLSSAAAEITQAAGVHVGLEEARIPVSEEVRSACELLGFDPLYVANEGRFMAFVPQAEVAKALAVLHEHPLGRGAAVIGRVVAAPAGLVTLRTAIGGERVVDMLSGEQLPRIC